MIDWQESGGVGEWDGGFWRERSSDYVPDPSPNKPVVYALERIQVLSGQQFVTEAGFCFTPVFCGANKKRCGYCTRSGGVIGKIWTTNRTVENTNACANRVLRCRGSVEEERAYHQSQKTFTASATETRRRYRHMHFDQFDGALVEALQHYDDPHVKRALRMFAMATLRGQGGLDRFVDISRKIENIYKLKTLEQLEDYKLPRAIGDLGVIKSLYGFVAAKILKRGQEETFWIGTARADFCPRATEACLAEAFKRHHAAQMSGDTVYDYFSDDSILTINGQHYDIDISKCDTSHGRTIFSYFVDVTQQEATNAKLSMVLNGLVTQLTLPIRIESPHRFAGQKRESVLFNTIDILDGKPTPALLSGSTITTALNNLACELMFESFARENAISPISCKEDVVAAAAKAGYLIKVKPVDRFEEIQFLKHSPVFDTDGEIRALLNVGVLMRAYGRIKYDYPGRGPLEKRAAPFHAQLFKSMYPKTHCPLLDTARRFHTSASAKAVQHFERDYRAKTLKENKRPLYITDEQFLLRYGPSAKHAAVERFFTMPVGTYASNPTLDLILEKDYGIVTCSANDRLPDNRTWTPAT